MPGLGSLVGGIRPIAGTKTSDVFITELNENGQPALGYADTGPMSATRRFQYFPESITDSKAVNWQTKEVPGGSLPIYQWVNSGERTITFTAVFTTDVDHYRNGGGAEKAAITTAVEQFNTSARGTEPTDDVLFSVETSVENMYGRLKGAGVMRRNVWIPAGLVWLRRFMLPRYGGTSQVGSPFTNPPRKLLLTMPGTKIELNGGAGGFDAGGIICVMTTCDITYQALFPSGNPRIVTVDLSFAQVPQLGNKVAFPSVTKAMDVFVDSFYNRSFLPGNKR